MVSNCYGVQSNFFLPFALHLPGSTSRLMLLYECKSAYTMFSFIAFRISANNLSDNNISPLTGLFIKNYNAVMKRTIFLTILLLNLAGLTFANPHNLLPRFPEIIIQQGMTEDYAVDSLIAIATIQDNYAHTVVNTDLRNISQTKAFTSVKFRILYPKNLSSVTIKINGSDFNYTPERNTYNFWLNPNEAVNFHIEADVSVNYSINAVRKALKEEEKAKKNIKTTFAEDFAAYFNTEKYGKRFMTGNIVSKWGIFPLSIKSLK